MTIKIQQHGIAATFRIFINVYIIIIIIIVIFNKLIQGLSCSTVYSDYNFMHDLWTFSEENQGFSHSLINLKEMRLKCVLICLFFFLSGFYVYILFCFRAI